MKIVHKIGVTVLNGVTANENQVFVVATLAKKQVVSSTILIMVGMIR